MNALQPTGGRQLATGTGLLLAVLVSVSLMGAVIVQWGRDSDVVRTPVAVLPTDTSALPEGGLPSGTPTTLAPGVVLSRNYGLWSYMATRGASGLTVDLSYRYATAFDLEEYIAMNKAQVDKLALAGGVSDVLVTFRQPVKPEAFREWVGARGLQARMASLRLSTPEGAHGTLTVSARAGDPLPQEALRQGKEAAFTIEGVYSVRGTAPAERLSEVASDPAVYLADVTPTLARLDLSDAGIAGAQTATINCTSPFREMEELGLVPR